jgi:tetratricopeptide (TPR) repeat protein
MPSPLSIFRRKTSKKIDTKSEAPDSYTSSLEQARALQIDGRFDDALVKFIAASDQLESTEGDIRLRMKVQEEIAFLHLRRDDLPAAEEAFVKHLKMRKKNMGQGDRVTLAASLNLARVYINQERMNDARKLIRLALKAYNEKDGSDCRAKFEAISCLADVSTHLGQADEACTLYQEALLGLESTSGPDDRHTLDTRFSLAMAHALMGRYIKAVDLLKEVIRRIEANTSGGNKDNLRARAQLCRIYLQMNQIRNAEIELRRCFEESEKMGIRATNNKHVVEATQALIELYRSDGKENEITPLQAWIKGKDTDMPLSTASVSNIVPLAETESKLEDDSEVRSNFILVVVKQSSC